MYVRNAWYCAGFSTELDEKGRIALAILGEPVVIYRKADGEAVALEDRCIHRFAPLHTGRVEGDAIRCMYHGILYAPSGEAIEIPGQSQIPDRACIRKYATVERGGWLWVWMGDIAAANEDLIPPVYGLDHPEWRLPADFLDFAANYELLNNNLTDLSHLSYVHEKSFNADTSWVKDQPKVSMIDRGVRFERWLPSMFPIPPLGKAANHPLTDQWVVVEYFVPGVFVLRSELYEQGTAALMDHQPPTGVKPLFRDYSQQCVTPTGPKTSRYFYAWGPHVDYGTKEESAIMADVLYRAFQEDKSMIENQQINIDYDPSRQVMPTASDKGVVLFQRLMHKMLREEQAQAQGQEREQGRKMTAGREPCQAVQSVA